MPALLPEVSFSGFADRLRELAPEPLSEDTLAALFTHYESLRRWSRRMSLIGPGTAEEFLTRHYGESLAALPFVPAAAVHVDVGSGAGFPGWVLAAARPGWRSTLVEARERKWAFLAAVTRQAALSLRCLNARVSSPLPEGFPERFDILTVRALKLPAAEWRELAERMSSGGRALLWVGEQQPSLPSSLRWTMTLPLPAARRRRLVIVEKNA